MKIIHCSCTGTYQSLVMFDMVQCARTAKVKRMTEKAYRYILSTYGHVFLLLQNYQFSKIEILKYWTNGVLTTIFRSHRPLKMIKWGIIGSKSINGWFRSKKLAFYKLFYNAHRTFLLIVFRLLIMKNASMHLSVGADCYSYQKFWLHGPFWS